MGWVLALLFTTCDLVLVKILRLSFLVSKMERIIVHTLGTSLVVQWLRICLPMQGTRVRALVQEDPTCRGATKPMHHNY